MDAHVIELPSGEQVRVTAAQLEVLEALRVCERKGMADATRREVLEVMAQQLGYEPREHVVSGRFSELVSLGVLEVPQKRHDRFTRAIAAKRGRASPVMAYCTAKPKQARLALGSSGSGAHVIEAAASGAMGGGAAQ